MGGTRAAAWPLIRHELGLSYTQVGLVLAVPGFVGSALGPLIGAAGDTTRRRPLLVAGGIAFALSAGLAAGAVGFWTLLVALAIANPATGAFVSLAQATWLVLLVLRRVDGLAYLRAGAAVSLLVYPAFLTVPGLTAKLVLAAALGLLNSGW